MLLKSLLKRRQMARISVKFLLNTTANVCGLLTLSLLAVTFCRLLITFANSLGPDQDRRNVGPDLGPNRLALSYSSGKMFLSIS